MNQDPLILTERAITKSHRLPKLTGRWGMTDELDARVADLDDGDRDLQRRLAARHVIRLNGPDTELLDELGLREVNMDPIATVVLENTRRDGMEHLVIRSVTSDTDLIPPKYQSSQRTQGRVLLGANHCVPVARIDGEIIRAGAATLTHPSVHVVLDVISNRVFLRGVKFPGQELPRDIGARRIIAGMNLGKTSHTSVLSFHGPIFMSGCVESRVGELV